MSSGYYRMHRGWMDGEAFAGVKLCEVAAWVWLIEHANFRDGKKLKRSQLSASVRYLAEEWNWSKSAVQRYLAKLTRRNMLSISRQKAGRNVGRLPAVITVLNYDKYQPLPGQPWDAERDAERDARGTDMGHERDNSEVRGNKGGSNLELEDTAQIPQPDDVNDKALEAIPPSLDRRKPPDKPKYESWMIEEFKRTFPQRSVPHPWAKAEKTFQALIEKGTELNLLLVASVRYRQAMEAEDQIGTPYVCQATTFLNQQRWIDYPPIYDPTDDPKNSAYAN